MSFFSLTDEERREWRAHPTTLAFVATIAEQIADASNDIASAMLDESEVSVNRARTEAGRLDAYRMIIKIMERDS